MKLSLKNLFWSSFCSFLFPSIHIHEISCYQIIICCFSVIPRQKVILSMKIQKAILKQNFDSRIGGQVVFRFLNLQEIEEEPPSQITKSQAAPAEMEYDEEGRPKGVSTLLDLIKEDLGEEQGERFRLFYDLMSNQIRYCLSSYMGGEEIQEEQIAKKASIISPQLLVSMFQQQKNMILSVVDQHEGQTQSKKTKNPPELVERELIIKLLPRTIQTKNAIAPTLSPLLSIRTLTTKELSLLFTHLSTRFGIPVTDIDLCIVRPDSKGGLTSREGWISFNYELHSQVRFGELFKEGDSEVSMRYDFISVGERREIEECLGKIETQAKRVKGQQNNEGTLSEMGVLEGQGNIKYSFIKLILGRKGYPWDRTNQRLKYEFQGSG